jgi:hypothetical protein
MPGRLVVARVIGRWVVQVSVPSFFSPGKILPSNDPHRHEAGEHDQDSAEDGNAASAPGKVCKLCGAIIKANQEARRRIDGEWIHEACPMRE